ncbi:sll1863 family stress response protein [Methanoplanus limicola]|uniref:Uncharacterized protein n=1 Tax=Methanoplanus limicola DSM 2279 TaxID=937775 RepID=H1YYN8_9EURY|nr:hypothetical protein [Methanoplanus limicola]EHQ36021.1 hypothetical protein Metlim_1929 [Methanoplanus limicola DSM 2279]
MTEIDPHITRMEAKIEEMDAEFNKIKARAKGKGADAEIQFNELAKEYEQKKSEMMKNMADFKSTGKNAAKDLKEGAEQAFGELTASFEKAKSRFS